MSNGLAIDIANLTRGYGRGKSRVDVLEKLGMKVPSGSIYGLLGPSGCGKTTLLKVVLGRLIPDSGEVSVLGGLPGSKGCAVPGSDVGYSPQEIALYDDLSIHETLLFHGRLHKMSKAAVHDREKWLISFLDLPVSKRQVGKLSGGQRRRVSLAVGLLHEPRLLLLDEPTVGVDPELRARIWSHLKDIAAGGTTIIITTHYIDEAGQADRVGLMRNGALLAEGAPEELMKPHGHKSLEQTFLLLCRRKPRDESIEIDELGTSIASKGAGDNGGQVKENATKVIGEPAGDWMKKDTSETGGDAIVGAAKVSATGVESESGTEEVSV